MKKIVKHVRSTSSHVQFALLGFMLFLGALALVAVSATVAQNARSPIVQQKNSESATEDPWQGSPVVRMMPDQALLGPFRLPGVEYASLVPKSLLPSANALINNNNGSTGTGFFTQSETSVVSFGNTILVGFNDSGSNSGGANKFTGFSRSTDSGATWTDGGTLPTSAAGDAGDPGLARDTSSGIIYFSTLGFSNSDVIQVFRSTDNGVTWGAPVNGTPGGSMEDKEWIAVDNFAGSGQGNLYLVARNFGLGNGVYFNRSTDAGSTWAPNGGTLIASGAPGNVQGGFVTVRPDHSVLVCWYDSVLPGIKASKSTDQGVTFSGPSTVVTFVSAGGTNGDLGLTGVRNGTATASAFRSNKFPHAAINPVNGNIYVAYNDKITAGSSDKSDIFFVQSTDGGATWSSRIQVNDDGTTTDQWQPNVVVSPAGDQIGIFYYSRQEDPANNNSFKYYGRIGSISGGTITFSPSFPVSDTASLPEFGRDTVTIVTYMGDYDQAFARSGSFDVVWSDNRDDLPGGAPRKDPNVYYQTIALTPTPTPTPTSTPTATFTPTPTATATATVTPTATATATFTPTPTLTPTPTPTAIPSSVSTVIWYMNNNVHFAGNHGPDLPFGWNIAGLADFNGDGYPDYLLFNASIGGTRIWYMRNNDRIGMAAGPNIPSGWTVVGAADFNGDGYPDYLLFNASIGGTRIWYMRNNDRIGQATGPDIPSGWSPVGAADFNGDGYPDYLLFNASIGGTRIWYMRNNDRIGMASGPDIPAGWSPVGAADFNGDGYPDYLLFNVSIGGTRIWYLRNNDRIGQAAGPNVPSGWTLVGTADFNRDGHPDYLLDKPVTP